MGAKLLALSLWIFSYFFQNFWLSGKKVEWILKSVKTHKFVKIYKSIPPCFRSTKNSKPQPTKIRGRNTLEMMKKYKKIHKDKVHKVRTPPVLISPSPPPHTSAWEPSKR